MELERRDTYIRLFNPVPGGHMVEYELVQGVKNLVPWLADAMCFRAATASLLQVRNA